MLLKRIIFIVENNRKICYLNYIIEIGNYFGEDLEDRKMNGVEIGFYVVEVYKGMVVMLF